MDKRAQLILTRAKELLARDGLAACWVDVPDSRNFKVMERQAACLSRAERPLLEEGRIDSVDQS
jgi:hypothetical protein